MPRAVKKPTPMAKPTAPVAPAPPPAPAPAPTVAATPALPVRYPKFEVDVFCVGFPKGPLDVEWGKKAMGWETEEEYQARKVKENPGTDAKNFVFGENGVPNKLTGAIQPVHCKDVAGKKVVCWNNAGNRSFDMGWCEHLQHMILSGQWAGPHTIPGETVNGETIRISRYGLVLSGQHSITACILADETLQKYRAERGREAADAKYPAWAGQDHVFIETIVVRGMSQDPRVLMTVDYVKPRTVADVFYTSELFKASTPVERKDLCRYLATAVDMLWTRTDARGYRTHPEIVAFLDRHRKLLDCVLHVHKVNDADKGRNLSSLYLSIGHCAALMYLMGCSEADDADGKYSDGYRNMEPAPSEKGLDWAAWDKAKSFWSVLGTPAGGEMYTVRRALGRLMDSTPGNEANQGQGGRTPEKFAILAAAWDLWKAQPAGAGSPFTEDDLEPGGALCLSYNDLDDAGNKLPDGKVKLVDVADFGGIDMPETNSSKGTKDKKTGPPMPPAPTPAEMEKLTQEAILRRQNAAK